MLKRLRGLPRDVWLVGLISLVNDSASDLIYPLLPLYLTSVLLAGPKALGLTKASPKPPAACSGLCRGPSAIAAAAPAPGS